MSTKRIILIDNHLIVQFFNWDAWWTCVKSSIASDEGLATWRNTPQNMSRAVKMAETTSIITTQLQPIQKETYWYIDERDSKPKTYIEAICAIARTIP